MSKQLRITVEFLVECPEEELPCDPSHICTDILYEAITFTDYGDGPLGLQVVEHETVKVKPIDE